MSDTPQSNRIRMKIGDHEFEAEGSAEMLQVQLSAFRELVASMVSSTVTALPPQSGVEARSTDDAIVAPNSSAHVRLEGILSADGRVISLTALPATVEDSALLIMLGQKELRNNLSVTGQEVGDGLAQSGKPVLRVDRVMDKHIRDALVLKTGLGRASRYRLTNQGLSRALSVARELVATLPS